MNERLERLRCQYRPGIIRLLFIGESPPASGRFFYQRDSGLYRAMRDAFQHVDSSITDDTFLDFFRNSGCYLIDLCPDPVDDLPAAVRRRACSTAEVSLSQTLRRLRPAKSATLLRSIHCNVQRAAQIAGWEGPMVSLPYPGRWLRSRLEFTQLLAPVLRSLYLD